MIIKTSVVIIQPTVVIVKPSDVLTKPGLGVLFSLILGLATLLPMAAAQKLDIPANLEKGFLHFYNLEYDEAIRWFRQELKENPGSARPHNHLAQAILYKVLFRAGALETQLVSGNNPFLRRTKAEITPEEKADFFRAVDSVFNLTAKALEKNPNDTDAMYSRGIAYGLRANYSFLVEKSWRDALSDATEARKLHNRVAELKPDFVDARLVQGAHDYVVGSLPWYYKALGFLIGFRGDKEQGIRTMEDVAQNGTRVPWDAKVLLCAIYRREGKELMPKAIPLLHELSSKFPRNHLFRLELVQLYSDLGEEQKAKEVFQAMEKAIAADKDFFHAMPLARLSFAKGNFQFWYRDYSKALENLKAATAKAEELDLHTSVLAFMRLGQTYDLLGNRQAAKLAYESAVRMAPESDVAKESRGYLRNPFERRDV